MAAPIMPTGAVLGLDTAGPVVGAALVDGRGKVLGEWSARTVRGADAVLLPAIAELLGLEGSPLVGIGVTVGPGAFTGLRVGLATALGLALSRNVPVLPVSSLQARAALVGGEGPVLALLDARKSRVYAGWFAAGGTPLPLSEEWDLDLATVLARSAGPDARAVGEGARVYAATLEAAGLTIVPDPGRSPATAVARIAQASAGEAWLPPSAVALHYLRPPDAKKPTRVPGGLRGSR